MFSHLYPHVWRQCVTQSSVPLLHVHTARNVSTRSIGPLAVAVSSLRPEVQRLHKEVTEFVRENIIPIEQEIRDWDEKQTWKVHPKIEQLQVQARQAGLWNFFVPVDADPEKKYGAGLTNLEYAHICEVTGLSFYAPEVFNCNAPDTGNIGENKISALGVSPKRVKSRRRKRRRR